MSFHKKKQKIKIIELDNSSIGQKFEIDSVSGFSTLNREIKKNVQKPYDIFILKDKELKKINKHIFNRNSETNKELYLEKKENLFQSENSVIYDNLDINAKKELDEKTICSICYNKLKDKPYYCYSCHLLYCDNCFQKFKIFKKKMCKSWVNIVCLVKKYVKIVKKIIKSNMQNVLNAFF